MTATLCSACDQPMLPKGQKRDHLDEYRHAAGCPLDDASGQIESDDDGCIHVSYAEQAGGFLICDNCGRDVTSEIFKSAAR